MDIKTLARTRAGIPKRFWPLPEEEKLWGREARHAKWETIFVILSVIFIALCFISLYHPL